MVVLLLVYASTVAYSAVEVAQSSPQSHSLEPSFAANGTIEVTGSFSVSNPGLYPIQGFALSARVANETGALLGTTGVGPSNIAPSSTVEFPIALFVPVSAHGPAASLLTKDQVLEVNAWGNATFAYLFPLSLSLSENRSWGAPFEGLVVGVGTPTVQGGTIVVPVTVQFSNHASSADNGTLRFLLESSHSVVCGTGAFDLDVLSGAPYEDTQNVAVSSGCSLAGGEVLSTYATASGSVPLPSEAIP